MNIKCRFCDADLPSGVDKMEHERYCLQNPHEESCINCGKDDCLASGTSRFACEAWEEMSYE